jgi:adenylate cyclase
MALWNAPLDVKDHPLRACRAAVRCQQKLDERSEYYQEHYGVTLKARIGVHTGVVVVGNMGSRTRFDYTVLGDAANLASRLEGANKAFDSSIMISETTWLRCKDDLPCRTIAPITVLGRETPLWTYEPLWQKHDHLSAWKHWEAAMSHHREGEFKAAQEQLEQCDDSTPAKEKWLTQWKIQDWDGIFRLDSK